MKCAFLAKLICPQLVTPISLTSYGFRTVNVAQDPTCALACLRGGTARFRSHDSWLSHQQLAHTLKLCSFMTSSPKGTQNGVPTTHLQVGGQKQEVESARR
eukprot:1161231-Pelagomonas_calceolata.AAC.5